MLNFFETGCFTGAVAAGISSPTDLVRLVTIFIINYIAIALQCSLNTLNFTIRIRMQAYRKGGQPAPVPQSIHMDNLESNFDSGGGSGSSHSEHVESRLSFKYHNVFHAFYQIVREEGKC
jgi:hypothetical protein